jgi:zinc transporter ZupT
LAVAASAPLVLALVIHASSEGFALTSLLDAEKHRPRAMTGWLTVACAAPAFGMVVVGSIGLPDQAKPVVTSLVAGVLVRTAWNAYQIAATRGQRLAARGVTIVSAGLLASALTVLSHLG